LPLRGGYWHLGAHAGVFNLSLNNVRANSNNNIGFRSALFSLSEVIFPREYNQYGENKGTYFHANKAKD